MGKELLQPKKIARLLPRLALPTRRNTERIRLWRRLMKLEVVALQTSGYVLPAELRSVVALLL